MQKIQADCVFPLSSEPVVNGVVIFDDNGKIADVLNPEKQDYAISDVRKAKGVLCPGFVNMHCHLELSYLNRKIKKSGGLPSFINKVQKEKSKAADDIDSIVASMIKADNEMYAQGIVAVADISNTTHSIDIKVESSIYYHTFIELYAFSPAKAEKVMKKGEALYRNFAENIPAERLSLTPHSFYGVSRPLLHKLKKFAERHRLPLSLHHMESKAEEALFESKTGSLIDSFKRMGIDTASFKETGKRPLASCFDLLPANNPVLFVHNTYANHEDVAMAGRYFNKATWCFCPSSNLFIEDKLPDFSLYSNYFENNVTLGTDSLASTSHLSMVNEMKLVQERISLPPEILLKWASKNGAAFLNTAHQFGSVEKGKTPGLLLLKGVSGKNFSFKDVTEVKRIV